MIFINKVIFDMDGVLVDFVSAIEEALGMTIDDINEANKIPGTDLISSYLKSNSNFFENCNPLPDMNLMVGLMCHLLENGVDVEICSLTTVNHTNARKSKTRWLEHFDLDHIHTNFVSVGSSKGNFVDGTTLLIDDHKKNCMAALAAGGYAIHHKSAARTILDLTENYKFHN